VRGPFRAVKPPPSASYIRIGLPFVARLLQNKPSNYETRDTSSPVSGALSDPRLPGARHFAAALPHESNHAVHEYGVGQSAPCTAAASPASPQVAASGQGSFPWLPLSCRLERRELYRVSDVDDLAPDRVG